MNRVGNIPLHGIILKDYLLFCIALIFLFGDAGMVYSEARTEIIVTPEFSDSGFTKVEWSVNPHASYYSVMLENNEIYKGNAQATFISGLRDGEYDIKVKAFDQNGALLADSVLRSSLTVEHRSVRIVLLLTLLGALVFLSLIVALYLGNKKFSEDPVF